MDLFLFLNNFFSLILQRCEDTLRGGEKESEGEERGREGGRERREGRERRKGGRDGWKKTRFQTMMTVKTSLWNGA